MVVGRGVGVHMCAPCMPPQDKKCSTFEDTFQVEVYVNEIRSVTLIHACLCFESDYSLRSAEGA